MPTENPQETMRKLIVKTWQDENFKKALLSDPKATIEKETGIPFPKDVNVQVLEQTPKQVYLVLPPRPPQAELTDADLEKVAGGADGFWETFARSFSIIGCFFGW